MVQNAAQKGKEVAQERIKCSGLGGVKESLSDVSGRLFFGFSF